MRRGYDGMKTTPAEVVVVALLSAAAGACIWRVGALAAAREDAADPLSCLPGAANDFLNLSAAMAPGDSTALAAGVACAVAVFCLWGVKAFQGTFRRGEEHGSSRFSTKSEMARFADKENPTANILLAKDVSLRTTRAENFMLQRNRNVLVIGGSGSGKTRGYVKPNLMQVAHPLTVSASYARRVALALAAEKAAGKAAKDALCGGKAAEKRARLAARAAKKARGAADGAHEKACARGGDLERARKLSRSFVVTDPKGTTCAETGWAFAAAGYEIRELNVVDFSRSAGYNPLAYVESETDVQKVVTCLIRNTSSEQAAANAGDPFWENSERLLLNAIVNYACSQLPPEMRNLNTVAKLLDMASFDEKNPFSPFAGLMYELETGKEYRPSAASGDADKLDPSASMRGGEAPGGGKWEKTDGSGDPWVKVREPQPGHPAVRDWNAVTSGAPETIQSILISAKVRLGRIRPPEVADILAHDEIDLDTIGDKPTAVFLVPNDQDPTFNFIIAIFLWQMLERLYRMCATKYAGPPHDGALPVPVEVIMDEFANYFVPDIEKTISTCRSRGIGLHPILQNSAQGKARYADNWPTIVGNCDTLVFLGGKDPDTTKMLEEAMGQQTVTTDNTSQSNSWQSSSTSQAIAQHARALMQASEIERMPRNECLVLVTGVNPWRGPKTDIADHALYPLVDPGHKGARCPALSFVTPAWRECAGYAFEKPGLSAEFAMRVSHVLLTTGGDSENESRGWRLEVTFFLRNDADAGRAFRVEGEVFPHVGSFSANASFESAMSMSNRKVKGRDGEEHDVLSWNEYVGAYRIAPFTLAAGEELKVSLAWEVTDAALSFYAKDGAGKTCSAGLDAEIRCANAPTLRIAKTCACELSFIEDETAEAMERQSKVRLVEDGEQGA